MNLKMLSVCASLALMSSGCVSSGVKLGDPVPPQAIPADLRTCFDRLVPAPKQASMTVGELIALVSALKRSELEKSQCGKRLLVWTDRNINR